MKSLFFGALLAAAVTVSVPAHAYLVTFDYTNTNVAGGDYSGKTSPLLGANNVATPGSGIFVDTFSGKGGNANAFGCGLDTSSSLVALTGGTYGFRTGTLSGVAAAPAGDSTCYAYGPSADGSLSDTVRINYLGLPPGVDPTSHLSYIGLYYGSIDTYNDITFYGVDGKKLVTVTGTSLIDQFKGTPGNQLLDSSNIYVNIYFGEDEFFKDFEFHTNGRAFEMDNLVLGFNVPFPNKIPEPGSLALMGLGLGALSLTRRRRQNQAN